MSDPSPASLDPTYTPHIGPNRQYMRDIILGVNDGLVSIFLLVAGVVGGGFTSKAVLLSTIAAAIAGAVSMAAGEYIATKSQEEVFDSEEQLERQHLQTHRDLEKDEIREMFGDMGLHTDDVERIVDALDRDDEAFLKVMMALEFGVVEEERRSPWRASSLSGLLFIAGSLPSLLPFAFITSTGAALAVAGALAGVALFTVGVVKTFTTRTSWLAAGVENVLIAGAGAAISYAAGAFFDSVI